MTKTTSKAQDRDLYSEVTDAIVKSLETAGEWERPWTMVHNGAAFPTNVASRKMYRGVNVLLLWASAMEHGYTSGTWGTFKQWKTKGASVRKGERSTMVTLWKPFDRKATQADVDAGRASEVGGKVRGLLLRHYNVFAAEQVDGYEVPTVDPMPEAERDANAEAFFAAVGADVRFGGNDAAYAPSLDAIVCPTREQFADAAHYYATLAHEHGHWTGHKSRLDRDLTGRFGSKGYAAEELVAELTAAFVGAGLGFHAVTRDDHAAYVKHWISLLREDNRAIFTAASKAQQAADYLAGFSASDTADTNEEEAA